MSPLTVESILFCRPAIVVLLMSMVNEKQPFVLRCAVLYCFQSFLFKNEVGQSQIVQTLLPTTADGERNNQGTNLYLCWCFHLMTLGTLHHLCHPCVAILYTDANLSPNLFSSYCFFLSLFIVLLQYCFPIVPKLKCILLDCSTHLTEVFLCPNSSLHY